MFGCGGAHGLKVFSPCFVMEVYGGLSPELQPSNGDFAFFNIKCFYPPVFVLYILGGM